MLPCRADAKSESAELLLFPAWERIKVRAVEAKGRKVPEYLQPQLNLKDMCKRKIREHLLFLDPHTHLFGRVPRLEIPTSLHAYLLYDQTLDKKGEDILNAAAAAATSGNAADDDSSWTDDDSSSDDDSIDSSYDDSDDAAADNDDDSDDDDEV